MPRVAGIVIPGRAHHVTQRGNNRQDVFFVTNHVHLVVVPRSEESLAKAMGRTHFLYTQYVHRLHGRSGHLWQNRFYSCALGETHLWRALAYVERNPVRARLVRLAWRWPWSSAGVHCGEADASGLLDLRDFRAEWRPGRWQAALRQPEDEELASQLRRSTHTGRPLATDGILSKLEHLLGRRLRPLPVGRPKLGDKKTGRKESVK